MRIKYEIYRKLIHLSSIWIPFAIYYLDRVYALILFGIFMVIITTLEFLKIYSPLFSELYIEWFGPVLRPKEKKKHHFTGAFYVSVAALLSVALFPKYTAMAAISVMVISDTLASLIGIKFGKAKDGEKSAIGSAAFLISGLIVIIFISYYFNQGQSFLEAGGFAVVIATIVEFLANKLRIDDNLLIVVAVGLTMSLF